MQQPTRLISTPFAQEGEKTEIQNVTGEFDNSATYRLGFPPLTMQSIRLGGKPPKGTDFNGILFDITENISFLCKGGRYQYNAGLSTLIGGYPEGSNLLLDDNVTEVVSTVAGNQNNPNTDMTGWILKPNRTTAATAANVADASGETQQQINYNGGSKWHSRVGGYLENERVVLASGDIVKSTIDGNVNDPNVNMTGWVKTNSASQIFDESGVSQQEINNRLSQLVITPEHFGAVAGEADSSTTLNAAIVFCSANNYVLDGRGKTYNANSLVLKDNTHIKRININSNLFDTMNSVITTDYGMLAPLKNITLDTVYINGKRELHTNVTPQMDGGRCAVLIRRPIDGLRIINSKLNNSVTDGLMLFPVDFAINESEWFSFVKNVQVINTDLQWNGRWGCSADSVDGLLFDNVRSKFNGLDVAGGGDYTTGKSARLMDGTKHYGGAIDIEEYHGFSYSKNIRLRGGDYTENAAASILMQRTGAITTANRNITLDNLRLDSGSLNEAYPNKAMIIGGYSTTNTELSYRNLVVKDCNFGNGIVEFVGCDTTYLSELFDIESVVLTSSVVNTDKYYNFTIGDGYSNFYDTGYARKDKTAYFVGYNNQETAVNLYNESVIGKSTSLNIFDGGTVNSCLKINNQDDGYDMHFLNGVHAILTVRKYGSIIPAVDNIALIGDASHRFSKLFGYSMSLSNLSVFSNNAAAKTGGLVVGDFYRTSTGQVMVVF